VELYFLEQARAQIYDKRDKMHVWWEKSARGPNRRRSDPKAAPASMAAEGADAKNVAAAASASTSGSGAHAKNAAAAASANTVWSGTDAENAK